MKRLSLCTIVLSGFLCLLAQNPEGSYNPSVGNSLITPSVLQTVNENGTGTGSFSFGNSGSDLLEVFPDHEVILTITLSYIEPDHDDPIAAISGSAKELFSWSYQDQSFTAIQTTAVPAGYSGDISIAFRVKLNSDLPGLNGFNVNITPAPHQTGSNIQSDDATSIYTHTEMPCVAFVPVLTSSNQNNVICDGDMLYFTAEEGGVNYTFRLDGEIVQDGGDHVYSTNMISDGQTVDVVVTDENDCSGTSEIIMVTVNPCPPDLTPTVIVQPNIVHGIADFNLIVKVTELNFVNSIGQVIVLIPKDLRWTLTDGFDQSLTQLGMFPLNNGIWSYTNDSNHHIFTTDESIPAGSYTSFGFRVTFNSGDERGSYAIISTILTGSGGEVNQENNVDLESVDYFGL